MERPDSAALAHDLRNLIGIVRAQTDELFAMTRDVDPELREVSTDLQASASLAFDALQLLERWDSPKPVTVGLGALLWAMRLMDRNVGLGEIVRTRKATVVVPDTLRALQRLLTSMGDRSINAERADDGTVRIRSLARPADEDACKRAMTALAPLGLIASLQSERPWTVQIDARS